MFLLFALSSKLPRFGSHDLAQIGLSSETKPWELRSKRLDFGQISGSFRLKQTKNTIHSMFLAQNPYRSGSFRLKTEKTSNLDEFDKTIVFYYENVRSHDFCLFSWSFMPKICFSFILLYFFAQTYVSCAL